VAEGDASGEVQTVGPRPPVLHPADGRRRVVPPLRLLLDIMGAALASVSASATEPLPHLSVHGAPISLQETSSVQYILQQYMAASAGTGRGGDGDVQLCPEAGCSEACARSMRRSARGVAWPHGCQSPVVQGVQCCH